MTCRHAEDQIQAALDAPLTPSERARLDFHLATCPACRRAWDEYRWLSQASTAWARQPAEAETPPAVFTAQVLSRVAARPAARPLHLSLLAWGLCLAVLLVLSPAVSALLPPLPGWQPDWGWLPPASLLPNLAAVARVLPQQAWSLWAGGGGLIASRWAVLMLLVALPANGLLLLRARRAA